MQTNEIRYYTVEKHGGEESETWDSVIRHVVDSEEFSEPFQCMTGSVFLDHSGRNVLWDIVDGATKQRFGTEKPVMNSVLVYQDSDVGADNDTNTIYRTSTNGNDILHMTLPPGITRVKALDGGGTVLVAADFLSNADCYRYVIMVESREANPNIPVAVHEMAEMPHGKFYEDVLTTRSYAGTVHSQMTSFTGGRTTDMRSGLMLGGGLKQVSTQELKNW